MPEVALGESNYILRSPQTGELQEVPAAEADKVAAEQGLEYATPEEIERHNLEQRRGGAGQVALGLAETATRNATLGAVTSLSGGDDAARERAQYTGREYPGSSAAAGFAPAIAAGAATAGAGLGVAGTMALEGAAGAYGNVGSLTDEAFKRDQELSAEQVIGAAGTGFFLGAATAGIGSAIGKGVGAVRNRLVESSARVSRQAESKAAEAVGIAGADKAVFRAADNPVEAATLRKAADEARPGLARDVEAALSELDTHAAGTRKSTSSSALDEAFPGAPPAATGDAVRQSPPLRAIIQDIETSLPGDSPLRHATSMWKDDISKAADSSAFQKTATDIENEITALAEQSRDPELAKTLVKSRDDLRAYRSNPDLFGEGQAKAGATKVEQQQTLEQARATLGEMLNEHDYSQVAGTKAGRDIQQAASHYADAITALNPESAEAVNAAVARFVNEGPVATGNQVDALLAAPKGKRGVSRTEAAAPDMFEDIAGEVAETAVESIIPGGGLLRKAWKYRKHIFNLSEDARGKVASAAESFFAPRKGSAAFEEGMAKLKARQGQSGAVDAGSGKIRLFRAAEDEFLGNTASFSPDIDTARAYHDNPSFGGKNLFSTEVKISPKKLLDISAESQDAQLGNLIKAAGIDHPGAATADHMLAQEHVLSALRKKGIEWVRLTDTFPEGAETYTWIGGKGPKLSPYKAPKVQGMGKDELATELAEYDRLMSIGHEERALRVRDRIEEGIPGSTWRDAIEKARARQRQSGAVVIGGSGKLTTGSKKFLSEAQEVANTMGVGKNITDFSALPIEEGDEGVKSLLGYEHFRQTGNVKDNLGSSPGGLPQFTLEDGKLYMSNGRHRWTAARESGMESIEGVIRKYGPGGKELWRYEGPIRVNAAGAERGAVGAGADDLSKAFPPNERVMLADVRAKMPGMSRAEQDKTLIDMQRDGKLVLMRHDVPRKLTPTDLDAQMTVGDSVRDIAYFTPPKLSLKERRAAQAAAGKGEAGFVSTGPGVKDILTSPLAMPAIAGAAGLGGYAAYRHIDTPESYKKMRGAIELLTKEPERLADMLAQSMGDLPTEAPELHMAVAAKAAAAVEFLQSKLPPAFTFSLANPEGPPPSRSDMLELSSYVQGVTDVPGVLRGIGDGSAMPEAIEAFKAVYPAWYGELQETLTIQCQERARAGQVIPGMRIAQLTSLLDLDVDPTFSDEVAQIAHSSQDIKDQLKAKAPKPNAPSKAGNRSQPSTHGVES